MEHLTYTFSTMRGWKILFPLSLTLALGGMLVAAANFACSLSTGSDQIIPDSQAGIDPAPTYAPLNNSLLENPLQISDDPGQQYRFSQISVGYDHSCGLLTNGEVLCWGSNRLRGGIFVGQSQPPSGKFINIDSGYAHACWQETS